MKKVIQFLVFSLTPLFFLCGYDLLKRTLFTIDISGHDSFTFLIITPYIMYTLSGLILLLICNMALKITVSTRIPFEFLIGILLVFISNLYFFVPEIPLPYIFAMVFSSPFSGIFIGLYVCLFVILMYRRAKALTAQKTQKAEPQA